MVQWFKQSQKFSFITVIKKIFKYHMIYFVGCLKCRWYHPQIVSSYYFWAQHLRIFIDRIFFKCFRIILEGRQSKLKTAKNVLQKVQGYLSLFNWIVSSEGHSTHFQEIWQKKKTPDGQEKNSRHSTVSTKTKRKYQMSLNVS